jgi:hypothetical protein
MDIKLKTMTGHKKNRKKFGMKRIIISFSFISSILFFAILSRSDTFTGCTPGARIATNHFPRQIGVSSTGTAMIGGKPFFPFGFYHVSWESTAEERGKHLQAIANAGFNTIHASLKRFESIEDYGQFLKQANQLGVYVITEFGLAPTIPPLKVVNSLKDQPAVLGWNLADDVDDGTVYTSESVSKLYCQFTQADPEHLTYISGYTKDEIAQFINTVDAVGLQAYPIGHKDNQPISWTYNIIANARDLARKNRLIIGNVQAFPWNPGNPAAVKDPPIPSFKEIRNMTYQSSIAGVKGIVYFTYYDGYWNFSEHPKLWQQMQSLVPEIKQLSPMLLEGNYQEINLGSKNVLSGVWTLQNRGFVILVNTDRDRSQEISLALPTESVRATFPNHVNDLRFEQGKLSGVIQPLGVSIYSFDIGRNS